MTFDCKHCSKGFKYEAAFMKHRCTQMDRSEQLKSIIGQKAYEFYCYWLKKQNRKAPGIEVFATSMYYNSFVKFFNFCKSSGITDYNRYIDIMLKVSISPPVWCYSESYSMYLEQFDRRTTPIEQVEISVNTILSICEELEIDSSSFFDKILFTDILALINDRKLSPWLLLCSDKFKKWMIEQTIDNHKQLKRLINFEYWIEKFNKNTDSVKEIRNVVKALEI